MPIGQTIYTTRTLMGVLRDPQAMQPPSNYWLNLCFPRTVTFEDEFIDFGRLGAGLRKLAPLVVPTAQGRPIYSNSERVSRVKPAYLKPKDPVSATRVIQRTVGFGELVSQTDLTPQQRYDAIVADILKEHRRAIERRWEWMASEAIQFGQVTLEGEDYPKTLVDFERDAGNTVVLGSGARWGDTGVSILDSVQGFRDIVRKAKFGGPTNRLTIGSDVWEVMRHDDEIMNLLTQDFRDYNNGVSINLGLREGLDAEFVGRLAGTLEVWVYSDFYDDETGTQQPFMSPKDIVLTGNNVQGVRAFGAIQDKAANWQATSMFPKMWDAEDPSATFIMTQSAPLMVPVNPNNTLRARVVA